jgi:methionine-rich copper-binding protein CopC
MRRRFLVALVAAATVGTASMAALAHAFLNQAVPPVGGTVAKSPKEIRLTFSEGVEPRFSGIELATSDGRAIATGPAVRDPRDDKQLVLVLPPLGPGRYKVSWHVVSVDIHRNEGAYTFAVAP